jgi:hypothetical protein
MMRLTSIAVLVAVVPMSLVATASAHVVPDAARPAKAYTVTSKVDTQTATAGEDVVHVSGKVKPRAVGKTVILQARQKGRGTWAVSDRATIRSNGTYLLSDEPSTLGTWQYRVVKRRSAGVRKGTSPTLEVRVYGWQKLAQRPIGVFENIAVSSTAVVGGQPYAYSFQPRARGVTSYAEYPLRGLCTQLRTTYAMHDSAAVDSTSRITLALDGVIAVDQPLVKGQVVASTTDLTGAQLLRYDLVSTADPASYPAVLAPEVFCTK